MNKPERSLYTPQDFVDWRESGALDLTPKFQRRGVWTGPARSYFIDTLLRGMPVPPIYLRMVQAADSKKVIRQVVDGQQRVAAVLDYLAGNYRLSKTLTGDWKGKAFATLTKPQRDSIVSYTFSAEIFHGVSDLEVLEVFARLNTHGVALNAQELRNGRYFGLFKQSSYRLAFEHLEFWRIHGIFTERSIARMLEVELTSELLILQLDGMQDKKKSVEDFYAQYDQEFTKLVAVERGYRSVVDSISEVFTESLKDTEFHRPPLFYTLFAAVFHRIHGVPGEKLATLKKPLSKKDQSGLREAVDRLSDYVVRARADAPVPRAHEQFVAACLRQTDNIKPRQTRLAALYREAFLE